MVNNHVRLLVSDLLSLNLLHLDLDSLSRFTSHFEDCPNEYLQFNGVSDDDEGENLLLGIWVGDIVEVFTNEVDVEDPVYGVQI